MVSADIHFPDPLNFKVEMIHRSVDGGEVSTLRFKTGSGYVNLNFFDDCQIDTLVDTLLLFKTEQIAKGTTGGPVC